MLFMLPSFIAYKSYKLVGEVSRGDKGEQCRVSVVVRVGLYPGAASSPHFYTLMYIIMLGSPADMSMVSDSRVPSLFLICTPRAGSIEGRCQNGDIVNFVPSFSTIVVIIDINYCWKKYSGKLWVESVKILSSVGPTPRGLDTVLADCLGDKGCFPVTYLGDASLPTALTAHNLGPRQPTALSPLHRH